jgi:hypothetical protein
VQPSFDQDVLKTKLDQQMGALERGTLTACIGQRWIARRINLSSSAPIGVKMSHKPSTTQSRKTVPWALMADRFKSAMGKTTAKVWASQCELASEA